MVKYFSYFLEGYGSVLRLFAPSEPSNDWENLKKDWYQVGSYIEDAITHYKKEVDSYEGKFTPKAEVEARK